MSSTEIARPEQQLVRAIRADDFKQELAMALPPSVTPEHFVRIATTAILANPDVAKLEHRSIQRAFVQAAADGLMPDGKEAAITPRGGKAVYVPMIGGFRKKAAEHGWTLRTQVVYANDEFDHVVEDGVEKILHRPVRPGAERGDLIASYAIATHRDGRKLMTVLHPADIAKRRASSSYDKVWNEHPAAMWEKSAGRDVFGQLGLAEGDGAIQRMLAADILEHGEATDALYGPTAGRPAGPHDEPSVGTPVAAEPVPTDDEPVVGGEPLVVDEQDSADEEIVAAAREAAMFVVPNGQNKGKTLSELHDAGEDGQKWLVWALGKITNPEPYRIAIWNFCRVYLPEAYEEALQRQEAQAA